MGINYNFQTIMDLKLAAVFILIGFGCGLLAAAKVGIGVTNIENNIGKVKGNGGTVQVDQTTPAQPEPKKKGFLKRIFTKKDKI